MFEYVVTFGLMVIVFRYVIDYQMTAIDARSVTPGVEEYPKWIIQFVFPIGVCMLLIRVLFQMCYVALRAVKHGVT